MYQTLVCQPKIIHVFFRAVVSNAISLINSEKPRPDDWFSTNNCALQYSKLLEGVTPPAKRKREKTATGSDAEANETAEESLAKLLTKR